MSKLEELLQQQEDLKKQIKQVSKAERVEALKSVRSLCKQHGFTASMLKGALASGRTRRK